MFVDGVVCTGYFACLVDSFELTKMDTGLLSGDDEVDEGEEILDGKLFIASDNDLDEVFQSCCCILREPDNSVRENSVRQFGVRQFGVVFCCVFRLRVWLWLGDGAVNAERNGVCTSASPFLSQT